MNEPQHRQPSAARSPERALLTRAALAGAGGAGVGAIAGSLLALVGVLPAGLYASTVLTAVLGAAVGLLLMAWRGLELGPPAEAPPEPRRRDAGSRGDSRSSTTGTR